MQRGHQPWRINDQHKLTQLASTGLPVQRLHPLTRYVRALVPALGQWEQARIPLLLHPLAPFLLLLRGSLESRDAFFPYAFDCVCDPLCLHLRAAWSVAERRRCLRSTVES